MKNLNQCIIGIGSNREKERNLKCACEILSLWFTKISFSIPLASTPISIHKNSENYLNQTAIAWTDKSQKETLYFLKETEKKLGRKKEDKLSGSIPIDLDLVQWNGVILKEGEWNQSYFQSGLKQLIPTENETI